MQHRRGTTNPFVVLTAAPTTNGQGTLMSAWDSAAGSFGPATRPYRYLCKLVVTGGTGTAFTLYANESLAPTAAAWGIPTDPGGNLGLVCNGVPFPAGTYYFGVIDISVFAEACLVRTSGSGTATATLTELVEKQELRG